MADKQVIPDGTAFDSIVDIRLSDPQGARALTRRKGDLIDRILVATGSTSPSMPAETADQVRKKLFLGARLGLRQVCIGSDAFLRGLSHLRLGENFQAGNGLWLQALTADGESRLAPKIVIGANFSIAFWGHIAAVERIVIGSDVMVGSKVTIIDHNHGSYRRRTLRTGHSSAFASTV